MTPYYDADGITLWHGDCLDLMRGIPNASVDSIVTDPPYGLGFMGKAWDDLPPGLPWAQECLRVLRPGGHLLAFGGTRTWHRLAVAVEDAGFDVRDSLAWLYGQGFPKSSNLDGAWQGWGTALKPAFEPVVVARKPLAGTVAANVLAHGTGALNVDACRIVGPKPDTTRGASVNASSMAGPLGGQGRIEDDGRGRWPANVVLDESQAAELDKQSGNRPGMASQRHLSPSKPGIFGAGDGSNTKPEHVGYDDNGGASRFFYVAKAPRRERVTVEGVSHPTVKPLALMRWLVRLVTAPGGLVLEPFAGSGTTAEACLLEGLRCIAIERETIYLPLIEARLTRREPDLFGETA